MDALLFSLHISTLQIHASVSSLFRHNKIISTQHVYITTYAMYVCMISSPRFFIHQTMLLYNVTKSIDMYQNVSTIVFLYFLTQIYMLLQSVSYATSLATSPAMAAAMSAATSHGTS
jgi:hypothetical protein